MTNKNVFWLGTALIFFPSCRAFYQAAPVPTPILTKKGDGNIFLSFHDDASRFIHMHNSIYVNLTIITRNPA